MQRSNKSRRQFLRQSALAIGGMGGTMAFPSLGQNMEFMPRLVKKNEVAIPHPTQSQIDWQDCEVGIIYHFDISVATRKHTSGNNSYREVFNPLEYNPRKLDTDQWIEAAKAVGAKYAVFTATHFNGFMQWQSDIYPYGLKQAKWKNGKGDIVGDFVDSCRKAGIKPGIYLSTHRNAYWQLWDYYVEWGKGKGTKKQEEFNRAAERMVEELCSRYGPLVQIWFDAGTKLPREGGPDILPIFNKYQPHSIFYHGSERSDHRWIGNESGYADYPCWATMPGGELISHNSPSWKSILGTGDPEGTIWSPGMVDIPLRGANGVHNWFWAPNEEHGVYSNDELVKMYYDSVGRNCNFVIGEVVNPEGLVPEHDIKRLTEFGDEIRRRFQQPLGKTSGSGNKIRLDLGELQEVNHVVIQEDIKYGERVRSYKLEGRNENKSWVSLGEGISIGHKRIQRFESKRISAVRIIFKESRATPVINKLAVYKSS